MAASNLWMGGKVVAITGAARGIGKATAAALARRGAKVSIGDLDAELARETARALGPDALALELDVTDQDSVEAFVAATEDQLGAIDVFINNAGIMSTVRFLDEDWASIEQQFSINVMGVMHGVRAVAPRMLARGHGHVINIASTAGKFGVPGIATYCATKHAVVGLTEALRGELKGTPIDLSVVMPVIVRTELTSGVPDTRGLKTLQPEEVADAICEAIESKRYEVWCPRSAAALYRTTRLLPLKANDAITRMTKADEALLASIDSPARQAYNERIAHEGTSSERISV